MEGNAERSPTMVATAGRTDAQTVYLEMRTQIVSGALPPGTPLRETAVAGRFGVSRTPVREALRRLEQDRLLIPGSRGMEVRATGPQEVIQVYDMRILLEAEAASEAARSRTVTDLIRLEGLLARDRSLDGPDDATRGRTNLEFHAAMWEATHNAVLIDLMQRLTIHLVAVPHSTLSVPGRWDQSLDEHARMIEAVRDQDEAAARDLAAAHMTTARQIRLELLRDSMLRP
jgi:DNA-binding GntR family transcriptional regulator